MKLDDLEGKVVIITGAANGQGRARSSSLSRALASP